MDPMVARPKEPSAREREGRPLARRDPHRKVGEILAEKRRPRNALERLVRRAAARESWTQQLQALLSAGVAPHCRVASIEGDRMTIHVDSASWATRLRLELPSVKPAINALEDFAKVDMIRIRTV